MCISSATFFFFFFFLFLHETTALEQCSTVFCSGSFIRIHFPFHLQGGGQPPSCGSPGFNLSCSSLGDPVLRLPNSGDFIVRDISYVNQNIVLYDPGNCITGMVLKLNLTGSPYYGSMSSNYDNYTFFDCPNNETLSYSDTVYCLSNATNTVVATTNFTYANHLSNYSSCKFKGLYRLQITRRSYYTYRQSISTVSDLSRDLQLSWYAPDIKLYGAGGTGIFKLIGFIIGVPAAICAISVACCIGSSNRGEGTQRSNTETTQHNNVAIVPESQHVLPIGLDDSTIQSFEKVVVGESQRLSGPNHIACSICLSEYLPKDILRCIPECKHCFHAECIDEWLRINSTCPICRNSHAPSPAHIHS